MRDLADKKIEWRGIWFFVPVVIIRAIYIFLTFPDNIIEFGQEFILIMNISTGILTILGIIFLLKDNWKS